MFPTSLWRHLWCLSPTNFPKSCFSFITAHTTKSKCSQNHQTLLCTNHNKINSSCSQNISTSVWEHLRGSNPPSCQKSWFLFFTPHTTMSQNLAKITKLGYVPTIPRSIPFAPKLFPHHFGSIWKDWVQSVFKNHDFCFSPHTPLGHKI